MSQTPKKGQAALEFLTTYGWAFLIILVMIGAIAYFGILNPTRFLPERCTTTPELSCVDFKIATSGHVFLQVKQGIGKTIYVNGFSCTYDNTTVDSTMAMNGNPFAANSAWSPRYAITADCNFGSTSQISLLRGKKVKVLFNLTYQGSVGGLTHPSEGELFAEVQQ